MYNVHMYKCIRKKLLELNICNKNSSIYENDVGNESNDKKFAQWRDSSDELQSIKTNIMHGFRLSKFQGIPIIVKRRVVINPCYGDNNSDCEDKLRRSV